jgi:uncharacterized protein YbaP (TraB family)
MAPQHSFLITLLLALIPTLSPAELLAPECEPLLQIEEITHKKSVYGTGLLWRVSKIGTAPSFVFGTIHVADESITRLPEKVISALKSSSIFVMEVLPEPSEIMAFTSRMYFSNGQKLTDLLSQALFEEVVRLLGNYHLSADIVTLIKPWAAFLTLNYPSQSGQILDYKLLEIARENGAELKGLESVQEQLDIFDNLALEKQIKLLSDTVCHYAFVEDDFDLMKSMYLDRDISGLYAYAQRYSQFEDELYNELIKKLSIDRNYTMAERMQPQLGNGGAFIAIGAMHLVGDEGVLAILAKNDYEISLVY